jgi:hypothetical protein
MSKPKKPFTGNKVKTFTKAEPLDPDARLAPYRVPAPAPSKFTHVEGQQAMDFSRDEWDALTEESA